VKRAPENLMMKSENFNGKLLGHLPIESFRGLRFKVGIILAISFVIFASSLPFPYSLPSSPLFLCHPTLSSSFSPKQGMMKKMELTKGNIST